MLCAQGALMRQKSLHSELSYKRLSKGRFLWWPKDSDGALKNLLAHELQLLIWNGSPVSGVVAPMWKKVLVS